MRRLNSRNVLQTNGEMSIDHMNGRWSVRRTHTRALAVFRKDYHQANDCLKSCRFSDIYTRTIAAKKVSIKGIKRGEYSLCARGITVSSCRHNAAVAAVHADAAPMADNNAITTQAFFPQAYLSVIELHFFACLLIY